MRLLSKNKYHSNFLTSVFTYLFIYLFTKLNIFRKTQQNCLYSWEPLTHTIGEQKSRTDQYRKPSEKGAENCQYPINEQEPEQSLPLRQKGDIWLDVSAKSLPNCCHLASAFSGLYFKLSVWISIWKCPLSINERPNSVSMEESSTKSVPTAYNTQLMLSYYTRFIKIQLFRLPILLSNCLCTSLSLFLTSHRYRVRRIGQKMPQAPSIKSSF